MNPAQSHWGVGMTTFGLSIEDALAPGRSSCVPRCQKPHLPARDRAASVKRAALDYMFLDATGRPVGRIVAPQTPPVIGKHAPTFYLDRG